MGFEPMTLSLKINLTAKGTLFCPPEKNRTFFFRLKVGSSTNELQGDIINNVYSFALTKK